MGGLLSGLLLLGAVGCGADSGTSVQAAGSGKQKWDPRVKGPAREFLIRGGDNLVPSFGTEASVAERESASHVIHVWMRARVAEDWAADCKYLSRAYTKALVQDAYGVSNGKAATCPQALNFFGTEASGELVNTLTGPIDSLRTRDTVTGGPPHSEREAYALYHGPHRIDWLLPLTKENGVWRIAAAGPGERPE